MSWLLVERLVQVNDHDIGMPRNVKEIREDLDRLPIFHLMLWRLCLNLLLCCFNVCIREITHHRVRTLARLSGNFANLDQSNLPPNRWTKVLAFALPGYES